MLLALALRIGFTTGACSRGGIADGIGGVGVAVAVQQTLHAHAIRRADAAARAIRVDQTRHTGAVGLRGQESITRVANAQGRAVTVCAVSVGTAAAASTAIGGAIGKRIGTVGVQRAGGYRCRSAKPSSCWRRGCTWLAVGCVSHIPRWYCTAHRKTHSCCKLAP